MSDQNNQSSIDELLEQSPVSSNNNDATTATQIEELVVEAPSEDNEFTAVSQDVIPYSSEMVIDLLKKSLNIHWQQTTALTAQAIHLDRWGYKKLAAIIKKDAEQEHEHSAINLERLEFFDIDYQPLTINLPSWTRHDMVSMIRYNLNSVQEAAAAEKATITAARAVGDEMTAHIMIPLLQGSEDGIRLYEGYLKLIEQMGIDNFLTLQV